MVGEAGDSLASLPREDFIVNGEEVSLVKTNALLMGLHEVMVICVQTQRLLNWVGLMLDGPCDPPGPDRSLEYLRLLGVLNVVEAHFTYRPL